MSLVAYFDKTQLISRNIQNSRLVPVNREKSTKITENILNAKDTIPNFDYLKSMTSYASTPPQYMVNFLQKSEHYCVAVIDIVRSSEISSSLTLKKIEKYYSSFLNIMAKIIHQNRGFVIKNIGDCLLFYFPDFAKTQTNNKFINCLNCCLEMIEMHKGLNQVFKEMKLPPINYRISIDFGEVSIMKTNFSPNIDLFGNPVNRCIKINHLAKQNDIVIGRDAYEVMKKCRDFIFEKTGCYSVNTEFVYPVYSLKN